MTAARRLLVALAGAEDSTLVAELAWLLGPAEPGLEVRLVHVVDSGPRGLLPHGPGHRRGPWPGAPGGPMDARLTGAEDEAAAALLASWAERFAAGLPGAAVTTDVRRGQPEREIIAAAVAFRASAVVLCPRPRTGPMEAGPRSVGHVARFVLDHAPTPVLLLRRAA